MNTPKGPIYEFLVWQKRRLMEPIIRPDEVQPQFGVAAGTEGFRATREAAYEQIFGQPLSVSHELLPLVPHIDVYTFQRKRGDQIEYSLVTGGIKRY